MVDTSMLSIIYIKLFFCFWIFDFGDDNLIIQVDLVTFLTFDIFHQVVYTCTN